jgi:hypothetical protein
MDAGDGNPEHHEPNCPRAALQRLCNTPGKRIILSCPRCSKTAIEINTSDFFECRKCHTQYSASITPGHITATLPHTRLIDWDRDDVVPVAILPERGEGKFRFDRMIDPYHKQVEEWRARKGSKNE